MTDPFVKAADEATRLKQAPSRDEKLELYAFYKQAKFGDVNCECPGIFNFTENAKWKAWDSKKGLSMDESKAAYIDLVEKLKEKYGLE